MQVEKIFLRSSSSSVIFLLDGRNFWCLFEEREISQFSLYNAASNSRSIFTAVESHQLHSIYSLQVHSLTTAYEYSEIRNFSARKRIFDFFRDSVTTNARWIL